MKKIINTIALLLIAVAVSAQTAREVLDKTAKTLSNKGGITASFSIKNGAAAHYEEERHKKQEPQKVERAEHGHDYEAVGDVRPSDWHEQVWFDEQRWQLLSAEAHEEVKEQEYWQYGKDKFLVAAPCSPSEHGA